MGINLIMVNITEEDFQRLMFNVDKFESQEQTPW